MLMTALTGTLTIVNKRGLHARAAAKLAKLAAQFQCNITVARAGTTAPARNILDLLLLAGAQGKNVTLSCDGPDAEAAYAALSALITRGFDEDDTDGS